MATALDIINRAGRRSKILADEAAFTASDLVDSLQLMNDMMQGFGPMGIYYAHTPLAATDTVNVPDEQLRNLVLMLTKELAVNFGMPLDPDLSLMIERAKGELQAAYYMARPAITDPLLRSRWSPFVISRG